MADITFHQARGYLPSQRASPPFFGHYQIIPLGAEAHVCAQFAQSCYLITKQPGIDIPKTYTIHPDSCIHHLIREKRDESILPRLRKPSQYSISLARTERFKRSFVLYALHSFTTDISEDFCNDFIDS